jgi:hypothetical protein
MSRQALPDTILDRPLLAQSGRMGQHGCLLPSNVVQICCNLPPSDGPAVAIVLLELMLFLRYLIVFAWAGFHTWSNTRMKFPPRNLTTSSLEKPNLSRASVRFGKSAFDAIPFG